MSKQRNGGHVQEAQLAHIVRQISRPAQAVVRNYESSGEYATNFYPSAATGLTDVHLPELTASPSKQTISQQSPRLVSKNAAIIMQSGSKPSLLTNTDCRSQIRFTKPKKRSKPSASKSNGAKLPRPKAQSKSHSYAYEQNPYINHQRKRSKMPLPAGLPRSSQQKAATQLQMTASSNRTALIDAAQTAPPKKTILLSEQEKQTFGNRCPSGYQKQYLLGKGGIALVWLGIEAETGRQVAMKQFPKTNGKFDSSASVEVQIQNRIQERAAGAPGLDNIC